MSVDLEASLEQLSRADRLVDAQVAERRSLNPARAVASPARQVVLELARSREVDPALLATLADVLARTLRAMVEEFPGNLFWDVDYLAAALVEDSQQRADEPRRHLDESGELLVSLQRLFGRSSSIHFSYVHDFIYGFDWAKWVQRDPAERASIGPFDQLFLRALLGRGRELLALIEADDRKYPRLPNGQIRNPFGFSRAPTAERQLHESLADSGLIPVQTWRLDARPEATRRYSELRRQRAADLAIERYRER